MKFSIDKENVDKIVNELTLFSCDIDYAFDKFQESLTDILTKISYNKLLTVTKNIVEVYNNEICGCLRQKLIDCWIEEGASLHYFAEKFYMGEEAEAVVKSIESTLKELFVTRKENKLSELYFENNANVKQEDFDDVINVFNSFKQEIELMTDSKKTYFENEIAENELYRFLLPIIESINVSILSFLEAAQKNLDTLKENYSIKMESFKERVADSKQSKKLALDPSLFDFDGIGSGKSKPNGSKDIANSNEKNKKSNNKNESEKNSNEDSSNKEEKITSIKEFIKVFKEKVKAAKSGAPDAIAKLVEWLKKHKNLVTQILKILPSLLALLPASPELKVLTTILPKISSVLEGKVETKEDTDKADFAVKFLEKIFDLEEMDSDSDIENNIQSNPEKSINNITYYIYENANAMRNLGMIPPSLYNELKSSQHYSFEVNSAKLMPQSYSSGAAVDIKQNMDKTPLNINKSEMNNLTSLIGENFNSLNIHADEVFNDAQKIIDETDGDVVEIPENSVITKVVKQINDVTSKSKNQELLKQVEEGKYNKADLENLVNEITEGEGVADSIKNYIRQQYGYPKIMSMPKRSEIKSIYDNEFINECLDKIPDINQEIDAILKNKALHIKLSENTNIFKYIEQINKIAEKEGIYNTIDCNECEEYNANEIKNLQEQLKHDYNKGNNLKDSTYNYLSCRKNEQEKYEDDIILNLKNDDILENVTNEVNSLFQSNNSDFIELNPDTALYKAVNKMEKSAERHNVTAPIRKKQNGKYALKDIERIRPILRKASLSASHQDSKHNADVLVVQDYNELIAIIDNNEELFIVKNEALRNSICSAKELYEKENYAEERNNITNFIFKIGVAGVTAITCGWPAALLVLLFGFNGDENTNSLARLIASIGEERTERLLSNYICNNEYFEMV